MSLLDNMPHTCSAYLRTRTTDELGGSKDSYSTLVFADRACWLQPAGDKDVRDFQKQGIDVSGKIYFTEDPNLDSRHLIVVLDSDESALGTWLAHSRPKPDASAALGVLFKLLVEKSTSGSTPLGVVTLVMLTLLQLSGMPIADLLIMST